jgi:hypothetical protein
MLVSISLIGGKPVNHYSEITLIQAARAGSLQIESADRKFNVGLKRESCSASLV